MAELPNQNQEDVAFQNDNATIKSLLEIISRQNEEIEQLRAGQNNMIKDDITSIKQIISSIAGKLDKFIQVFTKFIDTKIKRE
ncbi:MAG TPA: hypothetical protein PLZ62_01620 [bacterium]|nr:hypothetical protein [bacterium]